ncbi:Protein of unknown function [Cruoricaptor ignavus]|uniref:DUF3037 domain-containing protein n=1 Tax=Cruoricaptor ignavus TaxID=1118202 RepID=A0A1M5ZXS9_9FLAO|nr:DUF3037 domain-containing protein [Cruoricaptor ignavus]SHI29032.1 Protein of unknown function [Cruoricaptor ignavus]
MHADKLYEYAVIRLVPKPEREEFFNIGVVMFSKKEKFIRVETKICPKKFALFCPELELKEIERSLDYFKKIANGDNFASPLSHLEIPERFRWLTAVRSAIIQTSRPHPGKSADLNKTFERLFAEAVL